MDLSMSKEYPDVLFIRLDKLAKEGDTTVRDMNNTHPSPVKQAGEGQRKVARL
jgi:hypothetical protein